ncbi:MAG TPA: glutamyl-tRNA reductase [Membranihabitans sp.]|nr:glutamyl-tRNA reductase [Membranihabitans sp.]
MIDNYKILTVNYSDAQLDELGRFLVPQNSRDEPDFDLVKLKSFLSVEELFYLQTCNRVLYLFYSTLSLTELHSGLVKFLRQRSSEPSKNFGMKMYMGEDAVRHFFEVTSSLRSMVVGEHEILRQVREAYDRNRHNGLSGDQIRILFQSALQTAKLIHNKTRISEKTVSVVSLAMKKLRRLGIHHQDEIILIGAGDTMQTVARFLQEWKMEKVKIFNRSRENLQAIQKNLPQASTYSLDELPHHNLNVPFIISCTGHLEYVLTPELVEETTGSQGMSMCRGILDLAVPRDVHPEIITRFGLKVIDVESLRKVAEKNKEFRRKEMVAAYGWIDTELDAFREKVHRRFIERAFQDVPALVYATRDKALQHVFRNQIQELDQKSQDLIQDIVNYMAEKCISIPMQTARQQYTALRQAQNMLKKNRRENSNTTSDTESSDT